jgi:hypothetical protein
MPVSDFQGLGHAVALQQSFIHPTAVNSRLLDLSGSGLPSPKPDLRDGEAVVTTVSQSRSRAAYRVTVLPRDILFDDSYGVQTRESQYRCRVILQVLIWLAG